VTSAFIIQVQPQLQSDPNEETAALLRVLIYKIDNTTFGDNIPPIPLWSGPPHPTVQVQAILYASLAASLFSAFLAMLGKQWLNRYASIDMRGSAIERSQNRQRKLDGIDAWYFDTLMESLPLMLQFALLLLGCALSLYLWEIHTTVASVVIGVTSVGVAFYALFVVAGTTSVSCPYQTPGAYALRRILPLVRSALGSAFSLSKVTYWVAVWWEGATNEFRRSIVHLSVLSAMTLLLPVILLMSLAIDIYFLARAMVRGLVANALGWFHRAHGRPPQTTVLDLQCISWMLRTSLDKTILLLTLRLLATMIMSASFDPDLISACLDILAGCVSNVGGKVAILQGSEELAELSALCCLSTLSHITAVDPATSVFKGVRRRYIKTFPIETDFRNVPSYHRFCIIHNIFHPSHKRVDSQGRYHIDHRPQIRWRDYKLSSREHDALVRFARFEYQRKQRKVPRWIIHYSHHVLSLDPVPPVSVIADCLSMIAMDLGLSTAFLGERYVHVRLISTLLTKNQYMGEGPFEPDS